MAIVRLKWANNAATDIHLVPGLSSPQLVRLLRVDDITGGTLTPDLPLPAGTRVTFTPQVNPNIPHGFSVDGNGQVSVTSLAMRNHSFMLKASLDQSPDIFTRVRIHVHEKLSEVWLTPSSLTVRQGAEGTRFSALAIFDRKLDGAVLLEAGIFGDISNWSPFVKPQTADEVTYVHATGSTTPVLTWSATGGSITVDSQTGILAAPVENVVSTKVTVTAATPGGTRTADGNAVTGPPWSTRVKLKHLAGPGVKKINAVPNILFLPDGFQDTEADRNAYFRIVNVVRDRLESRSRSRPYAALSGRINYWRGWVPSPEAGITVLNELNPFGTGPGGTPERAGNVPIPSGARPATFGVADIVEAIGLPNASDYPDGTLAKDKVSFLKNLYGDFITADLLQNPDPTKDSFPAWVSLNDRMLLNERNTAFHMVFGERPGVDQRRLEHLISMNPRRVPDNDFNKFLDALRGENDEVLPTGLWTTGKDRNRVVVICRTSHHGGLAANRKVSDTSSGITVAVALADRQFHQIKQSTHDSGFDLKPDDIPTDVFFAVWLTVAHELGHSFGLGDEYGGRTTAPTAPQINQVRLQPNVQDRASIVVSGPSGDTIDVGKIKWSDWPRIEKAGLLRNGLTPPVGGRFTVDLVDVKASRLQPGDVVKFRRRPLVTAGAPSDICKVLVVDPNTNQVFVEPLLGGSVDPTRFPAGSILFAYVRKPDDVAHNVLGGVLNLAEDDVLDRIATTQNPLNAEPTDSEGRACGNVRLPVPTLATNFPDHKPPHPIRFSAWTIGIYENGSDHNCGIYRPTGTCIMNRQSIENVQAKTLFLYEFCLVCRYAFIDAADPTLHGQVELDFRDKYGRRGAR
jgi:hypothetical protein